MYHLNVMQAIVRVMAWSITKVMRVSGAETTSVCASVFIGQTEAPLTVRPYIARMTQSELLTMMIGGMAHIAGGVLAPTWACWAAAIRRSRLSTPSTCWPASWRPGHPGRGQAADSGNRHPLTRGTVKMEVERPPATSSMPPLPAPVTA